MFRGYPVGIKVDILDYNHDVYSPAIVIRNHISSIDVSYLGWGSDWDENIKEIDRVSLNSTKYVKAWVKLNQSICLWPCVLYLRMPLKGSSKGEEYLRTETRMLTYPCGHHSRCPFKLVVKPNGTWVSVKHVFPFGTSADKLRIAKGEMHKHREFFSEALEQLQNDKDSVIYPFRLDSSFDLGPAPEIKRSKPVKSIQSNHVASAGVGSTAEATVCYGVKISYADDYEAKNVSDEAQQVIDVTRPTYTLKFNGVSAGDLPQTTSATANSELVLSGTNYIDMVTRTKSLLAPVTKSKRPAASVEESLASVSPPPSACEPTLPSVAALNAVVSTIGRDYNAVFGRSARGTKRKPRSDETSRSGFDKSLSDAQTVVQETLFPDKGVQHYAKAALSENERRQVDSSSSSRKSRDSAFATFSDSASRIHDWTVQEFCLPAGKLAREMKALDARLQKSSSAASGAGKRKRTTSSRTPVSSPTVASRSSAVTSELTPKEVLSPSPVKSDEGRKHSVGTGSGSDSKLSRNGFIFHLNTTEVGVITGDSAKKPNGTRRSLTFSVSVTTPVKHNISEPGCADGGERNLRDVLKCKDSGAALVESAKRRKIQSN
jgi:1-acyl-sn-glycerol-3-phosphate acyltransferase